MIAKASVKDASTLLQYLMTWPEEIKDLLPLATTVPGCYNALPEKINNRFLTRDHPDCQRTERESQQQSHWIFLKTVESDSLSKHTQDTVAGSEIKGQTTDRRHIPVPFWLWLSLWLFNRDWTS